MIAVLVALNVFQFWRNGDDKVFTLDHAVTAARLALDAQTKIDNHELEQEKFNETVLQAFEEIKTKWTQSPTKQKH